MRGMKLIASVVAVLVLLSVAWVYGWWPRRAAAPARHGVVVAQPAPQAAPTPPVTARTEVTVAPGPTPTPAPVEVTAPAAIVVEDQTLEADLKARLEKTERALASTQRELNNMANSTKEVDHRLVKTIETTYTEAEVDAAIAKAKAEAEAAAMAKHQGVETRVVILEENRGSVAKRLDANDAIDTAQTEAIIGVADGVATLASRKTGGFLGIGKKPISPGVAAAMARIKAKVQTVRKQ